MINKELSVTLGFAVREAKKRRHEYVCIEHVLYAILHDSNGIDIIENCSGNVENLKFKLETFFDEQLEQIPEGKEYVLQQTVLKAKVSYLFIFTAGFFLIGHH